MREDLLGYLLGALEPEEMERISEALRTDPALRAELEQLERAIRPLDDANDIYEPPAGLIGRAMDMIPFADPAPIDSVSEDNAPRSDLPFVGSPTDSAANGFDYGMDHAELAENDSAWRSRIP